MKKLISLFALSVFCLVLSAPVWAVESDGTCQGTTDASDQKLVQVGTDSDGNPIMGLPPVE